MLPAGTVGPPQAAYQTPHCQILSTEMKTWRQKGCVVHWADGGELDESSEWEQHTPSTWTSFSLLSSRAWKSSPSSEFWVLLPTNETPVKNAAFLEILKRLAGLKNCPITRTVVKTDFYSTGVFVQRWTNSQKFSHMFLLYPDYFLHCKNMLKTTYME